MASTVGTKVALDEEPTKQQQQKKKKPNNSRVERVGRNGMLRPCSSSSTGRYYYNLNNHGQSLNRSSCHRHSPKSANTSAPEQGFPTELKFPVVSHNGVPPARSGRKEDDGVVRGINCRKNGWRWSTVRDGIIRRKRRPVELMMGRRSADGGGGPVLHVHHRNSAAKKALLQWQQQEEYSSFESSESYSSDAADSSREEINLIFSQEMFTGSSSGRHHNNKPNDDDDDRHIIRDDPGWSSRGLLSHDYQPKVFEEIVGHDMVVKALSSAIQRKRISPLYLFHGPGGTGKTSAAKIFAMALNCESSSSSSSSSPSKPCWGCTGCSRSLYAAELCSGNRNDGFQRIRTLLYSTAFAQTFSSAFKVFIIDECQSLAADAWEQLLDIIEEEKGHVGSMVFIMITEDANLVPRSVSSRCQKFSFPKLKDTDVTLKLARIVAREGIEIQMDVLQLIATMADGNLREAENLLDQLGLLGQRITTSMVQQLVGLVPHEKLIHLLEAAFSGDSIEAVRCTRDLLATGTEPQALVSQLACLVTEILAGTSSSLPASSEDKEGSMGGGHSLLRNNQAERLCHTLKILIETEKQLITSPCNRTTWVTAALLQIAADSSPPSRISTSVVLPTDTTPADAKSDAGSQLNSTDINRDRVANQTGSSGTRIHHSVNSILEQTCINVNNLNTSIKGIDIEEVWRNILEGIKDKRLEEFLRGQAKLISLTVSRANAMVHLIFKHPEDKLEAEMSEESISNALKAALGCPVTVNISREPTQLEVATSSSVIHNEKQQVLVEPNQSRQENTPALAIYKPSGTLDGTGLVLKRSKSQQSAAPTSRSNLRSTRLQNSRQMFVNRDEHITRGHEDSTVRSQLIPSFPQGYCRDSSFRNLELDLSVKDQSLDTASIARATKHKHRLLSISSIPQTDASIEPYSQDLLFEEANTDRLQGTRNSRLDKYFSKTKQHNHNMTYMGLSRSWSCTDRFCRGDTLVKEDMMRLTTNRTVLNWVFRCKDSTILVSTTKKAQLDLRKTVPTSPSSL